MRVLRSMRGDARIGRPHAAHSLSAGPPFPVRPRPGARPRSDAGGDRAACRTRRSRRDRRSRACDDPVTLAGLVFPNRIGLAAGLDKNGRCIDGLRRDGLRLHRGRHRHAEGPAGQPEAAHVPPAVEASALINRLGFNNDGLDAFLANVRARARFRSSGGILGLNIGKNAATPIERAVDDYLPCLRGVYPHADYVTVNISSPNTKNLRDAAERRRARRAARALQQRRREARRRARPARADVREDRARPRRGAGRFDRRHAEAPRASTA